MTQLTMCRADCMEDTRMRMTTDLGEFCQMSCLFRVRRVSNGAFDVITLLQQLFYQFSANKAACTRHSRGVCTAMIDGAHTDLVTIRAQF